MWQKCRTASYRASYNASEHVEITNYLPAFAFRTKEQESKS